MCGYVQLTIEGLQCAGWVPLPVRSHGDRRHRLAIEFPAARRHIPMRRRRLHR
jgi:hypothetical protein